MTISMQPDETPNTTEMLGTQPAIALNPTTLPSGAISDDDSNAELGSNHDVKGPSTKAASAKLSKAHPRLWLKAPQRPQELPRVSKFQFSATPSVFDDNEDDSPPLPDIGEDEISKTTQGTLPEPPSRFLGRRSSKDPFGRRRSAQEKVAPPTPAARAEPLVDDYKPARVMQHFANSNTQVQSWGSSQSSTRIPVIEKTSSVVPPKGPRRAKEKGMPTDTPAGGDAAPSLDEKKLQEHVAKSPTCSLNLVCYRSGTQGCKLRQIQTLNRARLPSDDAFAKVLREQPQLVATDIAFFRELRTQYLWHMCSFWRRAFSLKTLCGFRLLQFTPTTRPTAVLLDEFEMQEILYAFRCPAHISTDRDWIDWVFRLRQVDRRHALEFVEGWNGARIAVAGSLPLLLSTVVGVVWSVRSGDVQTAFTVAGFILTAGTLMLALLAIISGIESSRVLGRNV